MYFWCHCFPRNFPLRINRYSAEHLFPRKHVLRGKILFRVSCVSTAGGRMVSAMLSLFSDHFSSPQSDTLYGSELRLTRKLVCPSMALASLIKPPRSSILCIFCFLFFLETSVQLNRAYTYYWLHLVSFFLLFVFFLPLHFHTIYLFVFMHYIFILHVLNRF